MHVPAQLASLLSTTAWHVLHTTLPLAHARPHDVEHLPSVVFKLCKFSHILSKSVLHRLAVAVCVIVCVCACVCKHHTVYIAMCVLCVHEGSNVCTFHTTRPVHTSKLFPFSSTRLQTATPPLPVCQAHSVTCM